MEMRAFSLRLHVWNDRQPGHDSRVVRPNGPYFLWNVGVSFDVLANERFLRIELTEGAGSFVTTEQTERLKLA